MIYLTKGQPLKDNPSLVVYDPTGYYNDGDSVICASAGLPEEPVCRYEAKFVAYGGMVYSVADPDALLAEIIKLDPKSLFGKDSQQVVVDKAVADIVPQESGDLFEDAPVDDVPAEQATTTTPTTEEITLPEAPAEELVTATTTPDVVLPEDASVSTTTPDAILPEESLVSTTTPEVASEPIISEPVIDIVVPPADITSSTAAPLE